MERYEPALNGTAFIGMIPCVQGGRYVLYTDLQDPLKLAEAANAIGFVICSKEQWDGINLQIDNNIRDIQNSERIISQWKNEVEIKEVALADKEATIAGLKDILKMFNPCGHSLVESKLCDVCGYPDPVRFIAGLREEVRGKGVALANQMTCVGELKLFLHNARERNAAITAEVGRYKAIIERAKDVWQFEEIWDAIETEIAQHALEEGKDAKS